MSPVIEGEKIHPLPQRPRIGSVPLENPFGLAPMAGIGDPPFRRLCRRGGAALVCTEMVSANALYFQSEKSEKMLSTFPDEHPVSVQVFGSEPDRLAQAARAAEESGADIIDLNCGCPVPKITKTGGGISLMKDEKLFASCVSALVKSVNRPVTVKMRLGFKRGENHALRFAAAAEAEGASALIVHARTQEDHHSGPPILDALHAVVARVHIPVWGNGGVHSVDDAQAMLATGVQGILVGQAAIGNPFIFMELLAGLRGIKTQIPVAQRMDLLREHAKLIVGYYGEEVGIRRLRKYLPSYFKGLPGAASLRAAANLATTHSGIVSILPTC